MIYTNQPLKRVLHKSDASGRLTIWVMELSQFALEYHPWTAIKDQTLVNFVVECSFSELDHRDQLGVEVNLVVDAQPIQSSWTFYVD